MDRKEEFRSFVKTNPALADYVNKGNMTWQKFYEMYDLYGEDRSIWDKYKTFAANPTQNSINKLSDLVKNVDMDSIQKHVNTAQKALGFIQDLTTKDASSIVKPKGPVSPRPINKFFED
jgi:hypothetical protein